MFLHTKHSPPVSILSYTDSKTQRHTVENTHGGTNTTFRQPSMHVCLCTQTSPDFSIYNYRHGGTLEYHPAHVPFCARSMHTTQRPLKASCRSWLRLPVPPRAQSVPTLPPCGHGYTVHQLQAWTTRPEEETGERQHPDISPCRSLHLEEPSCYWPLQSETGHSSRETRLEITAAGASHCGQ